MKVGAAMHAGIRIARVIEVGSSSIAGPIPVEKGNFDRIKAGRGKNHIRIHGYVAVAAIVVDDVDARDRDPRAIIGSCAQAHGAGIRDVDEAAETKYPIIKIVGVANKRTGVAGQPVRDVREVVAEVNKPGGPECPAWRAKAVDQVVDTVGGAGGAIRRNGVDRALPILAFEVATNSGE